jgi:hypothetical protein
LCWDMAGDKAGWSQALWVPIVGVVMALTIWLCDRVSMTQAAADGSWSRNLTSLFSSCSDLFSNPHPSTPSLSQNTAHTLELVHSSLHQSPVVVASPSDPFHRPQLTDNHLEGSRGIGRCIEGQPNNPSVEAQDEEAPDQMIV